MQTRNDGTHVILPAAAPIARRPDRAGWPVMMFRHSDGKLRHDDSRAANKQRCYPVAKRGRLHGASDLDARVRNRSIEHRILYRRSLEGERRWQKILSKYDRLRRQDKRAHIVRPSVGCIRWVFRRFPHIATFSRNVRFSAKRLMLFRNWQIVTGFPCFPGARLDVEVGYDCVYRKGNHDAPKARAFRN